MANNRRTDLLERRHWLVFLAPFIMYMVVGSFEPSPEEPGGKMLKLAIPYSYYPLIYTIKIALTIAAAIFVLPGYRRFPLRIGVLAPAVGVFGGLLWIAVCNLDLEHAYLQPLLGRIGLGWLIGAGDRPAFNPFVQLADQPALAWAFLAVRFLGLAAVVPLVEEFFLRGFLMRFVVDGDWWEVPFGKVNGMAIFVGTAVPMMMHPGELVAALLWFSMITWLMIRTKNIWDCVAAHAITNLTLGVYVVARGGDAWRLL